MKKLILLFVAAGAGFTAMAQVRGGDNYYAQRCIVDLNFPVGMVMQSPSSTFNFNYPNAINSSVGGLKMSTGLSYGVDAQFGYFVGKRRRFGIGGGILYLSQNSDATISDFHVEYKATDKKDNVYRQVVYATHPIKEKLKMTNMNIPIVLKFKQRFSTKLGFTVNAGIVYNLQMQNDWTTDATFNYEAIYKFNAARNGTVYDDGVTPESQDWLITKAQYDKHNTSGTTEGQFDSLHSRGYNVALNVNPDNKKGSVSYTTGSIGFILSPAVNYRLTKRFHLNLGATVVYQTFNNKSTDGYKLIDNMGSTYSSILNTVTSTTNMTFGINLGIRYFIGEAKDAQFDGKYDE